MTDQTALWTIMVYISGDSVLDNFAIESLKQLRRAAGGGVTVEVLFDPNFGGNPTRLRFDGNQDPNASLFEEVKGKRTSFKKDGIGEFPGPINVANPENLKEFINSVTGAPDSVAGSNRNYGLILWGHGTELLLDTEQPSRNKAGAGTDRNYLTPASIRDALAETKLLAKRSAMAGNKAIGDSSTKLDFIALDACSMSMVEVAFELQDYADFMIASQDDVPDQSFPYEAILSRLKAQGRQKDGAREACRMIPADYKDSFQDYFPAPGPAETSITLSSLNLQSVENVTVPLDRLAAALRGLAFEGNASQEARRAIISARSASRSFVLGLFVDLYDFCQNLEGKNLSEDVNSICKQIQDALTVDSRKDVLVLNNQTNEEGKVQCHGLSIYLPYLTAEESLNIEKSLTIGGTSIVTQLTKGASTTILHKNGSTTNLHKSRAARIAETEQDLASLKRFNDKTGWTNFIKGTWSFILAMEEPLELDLHYSAQQCVLNLRAFLCEASGKSRERAA